MDILLPTPLHYLGKEKTNKIYIKREDLTGFAFGGNKARKNIYFFKEAIMQGANHILTYGSIDSNHCRIVAAYAKKKGFKCTLILAETEKKEKKGNFILYNLFDAKILWTPINKVKENIEKAIEKTKEKGDIPFFIYGGAHGKLGVKSYIEAFEEINKIDKFDYIFLASGTGTTQAGLIVGNYLFNNSKCKIIGISIARKAEYGKIIIKDSIEEYLEKKVDIEIELEDSYIGEKYGDIYTEVIETIKDVSCRYNILLDPVYTGKAYYGMREYLKKNNIQNKKILFIHTGGTPLFFKYQDKFQEVIDA